MKTFRELNMEMQALAKELEEAKQRERIDALKEARFLCKEYEITASMLKGALSEGRKRGRRGKKQGS